MARETERGRVCVCVRERERANSNRGGDAFRSQASVMGGGGVRGNDICVRDAVTEKNAQRPHRE